MFGYVQNHSEQTFRFNRIINNEQQNSEPQDLKITLPALLERAQVIFFFLNATSILTMLLSAMMNTLTYLGNRVCRASHMWHYNSGSR